MQNAKCDSSKMQNDKNNRHVILPAVNYLLNFITAFMYNPLIFVLIIYFLLLNFIYIYNTIFDKNHFKFLYSKNTYIFLIIIITLFTIFRNIL